MKRLLLAGLVLLAAAQALPAAGAAADPPRTAPAGVLGAHTRITGSAPAMFRLRLANDATMAFPLGQRNPDLRVQGSGRFVGIVLVEENERFDGATLIAGAVRSCEEEGCSGKPYFLTHPLRERHDRVHLPSGDYRLFFLPDGAPASIELRLHGVEAKTVLPPAEDVDRVLGKPQVHASTGQDGFLLIAGDTYQLQTPGLIFNSIWLQGSPSAASDLGTCRYRGEPPVADALAYSAVCKEFGAKQHRSTTLSTGTWYREGLMTFDSGLRPGKWSSGVFYESTSPILRETRAWSLILEYGS